MISFFNFRCLVISKQLLLADITAHICEVQERRNCRESSHQIVHTFCRKSLGYACWNSFCIEDILHQPQGKVDHKKREKDVVLSNWEEEEKFHGLEAETLNTESMQQTSAAANGLVTCKPERHDVLTHTSLFSKFGSHFTITPSQSGTGGNKNLKGLQVSAHKTQNSLSWWREDGWKADLCLCFGAKPWDQDDVQQKKTNLFHSETFNFADT